MSRRASVIPLADVAPDGRGKPRPESSSSAFGSDTPTAMGWPPQLVSPSGQLARMSTRLTPSTLRPEPLAMSPSLPRTMHGRL